MAHLPSIIAPCSGKSKFRGSCSWPASWAVWVRSFWSTGKAYSSKRLRASSALQSSFIYERVGVGGFGARIQNRDDSERWERQTDYQLVPLVLGDERRVLLHVDFVAARVDAPGRLDFQQRF